MPPGFFFTKKLKKLCRLKQSGAALLYLVAAILIAGTLGAATVSLTITSTFSELSYNNSDKARHLAQSGLDYAKSALESDDSIGDMFRSGSIDETVFNLNNGQFILTVQDSDNDNVYHIESEGRVEVETNREAGFLVTGEHEIN